MTTTFEQQLEEKGFLLFTNVGCSMKPLIRQGKDAFLIEKKTDARCQKYDAVLYRRKERYILHRILQVRENDYVICGDNCVQLEYGITDEDILGVMTEVIRNGKPVPVTNLAYRCYVHLWCDLFPLRAALLRLRRVLGRIKRSIR